MTELQNTPTPHIGAKQGEIAETILLPGDPLRAKYIAEHFLTDAKQFNTTRNIAVKEQGDDIVFLRKIVKGGADKSYGIQVAKLAGVPAPVIDRAKELVEELSDADITARAKEIAENGPGTQTRKKVAKPDEVDLQQMSIFDTVNEDDIIKEIMELEVNRMSPLDALNTLDKLQAKLKNRWMHQ